MPTSYSNPVLARSFADPGVVRAAEDGAFYAYATGPRIQLARSVDLVNWQYLGFALSNASNYAWGDGVSFLAPDVTRLDASTYVMYYAGVRRQSARATATPPRKRTFCIGAALARSAAGPFEDVGRPLICRPGSANAIDPQRVVSSDGTTAFLFWGSGKAIYRTPLAPRSYGLLGGIEKSTVVLEKSTSGGSGYDRLVEAVWVDAAASASFAASAAAGSSSSTRDRIIMYYSGNRAMPTGNRSAHYAVSVASASRLDEARFVRKADAMELGGGGGAAGGGGGSTASSTILTQAVSPRRGGTAGGESSATSSSGDAPFFGAPGHNAIVYDDAGARWMLYHAYYRPHAGSSAATAESAEGACLVCGEEARVLMLDRVGEKGGWPWVGQPSTAERPAPFVRTRRSVPPSEG